MAVSGCIHGDLTKIYTDILKWKQANSVSREILLLVCGDFQSIRHEEDLQNMAVPSKYRKLGDFSRYYSGELVAPFLTIFIGGNHEGQNYLKDLYYGGWVAENIYFLGYSGVVDWNGLRIAGISGIYKGYDFRKGYTEMYPFSENEIKSVYHTREFEIMKMMHLERKDEDGSLCFLTHDWPTIIGDLTD